ncbi:hypothetical protein EN779_30700 [Mesorhizobium sp. M4B.F.Ca.ET.088.02.2.1]|nr:hypothetical protein EN779_30700 [Mesorhizobium sp. M4B.F.Ca.ET.088.02.2.1]
MPIDSVISWKPRGARKRLLSRMWPTSALSRTSSPEAKGKSGRLRLPFFAGASSWRVMSAIIADPM